jgi:hypothetical protein
VPRRAGKLLVYALEATVIGTLAFLAAAGRNGETDLALVAVGWAATAVATVCVVAFAFRTGGRDRAVDFGTPVRAGPAGEAVPVEPFSTPQDRTT